MYIIKWRSTLTDTTGLWTVNFKFKKQAEAEAKRLNKKFPGMVHWVEYKPKKETDFDRKYPE